ncbi:hypothetical protein BH20ACT21_BH20ACT21_10340 [soil metagenome]
MFQLLAVVKVAVIGIGIGALLVSAAALVGAVLILCEGFARRRRSRLVSDPRTLPVPPVLLSSADAGRAPTGLTQTSRKNATPAITQ